MVPIVLGAYKEDYISTLPPQSYINVDDFRSIRELAAYLKYLDKNDTAYATYFAWRQFGELVVSFQTFSLTKLRPLNVKRHLMSLFSSKRIPRPDCRLCGLTHQLRNGQTRLKNKPVGYYNDPNSLCFRRPLLPLR